MKLPLSSQRRAKPRFLGDTGQENLYLRSLSERKIQISVKLRDGERVRGWIEYFDDTMLRLTREEQPNLFIYKQQIQTISEVGQRTADQIPGAHHAITSRRLTRETDR
jgi:host factor-I protein